VAVPYQAVCEKIHCPKGIATLLSVLVVFSLTCLAWIFFRAKNLDAALYIVRALFSWEETAHLTFGGMKFQLLRVAAVVTIVLTVDFLASREKFRLLYLQHPYARSLLTGMVVLTILFTGRFDATSFIYFQF
jgi:alginate O-acetyltransferase complex protein AlgI